MSRRRMLPWYLAPLAVGHRRMRLRTGSRGILRVSAWVEAWYEANGHLVTRVDDGEFATFKVNP